MKFRLGIDVACRAAHQASLADEQGNFVWSGQRFTTTVQDLDRLWSRLPPGAVEVTVIMEPTRNAWVPLAAWFRRHGASVLLVPPERSADLRAYYAKHTKSDRLDSQMLARIPLLHPEGLHPEQGLGPGEALRRTVKQHSSLVRRRSQSLARLDALLEILGPGWNAALGADLANKTPMRFLAAGYADPHTLKRLGRARIARFLSRHSRGAWGEAEAARLIDVAGETLQLWHGELDYGDLADDIALEARLALQLTEELTELDQRTAVLLKAADPDGIIASAPGVGPVTAAVICGRLGDPARFTSLAGVRSFTGLVPALDASGASGRHGGPTKRGDALLREALFMAADQARRLDPTLAAKYHRLLTEAGKHHNSALCHIAMTLLTRIVACQRSGKHYVLRDTDGREVSQQEARLIIAERYTISPKLRASRRTTQGTDRRSKKSQNASSTGPSLTNATTPNAA
ncbi:MAG TPA: IS110 family transposase [Propionibacteriaceae bacterium]|jgi:transposase